MKTTIGDFPVNWLRLFLQTPFRKRGRDVNRSNTSTLDVPLSVTRRCQVVLRRNLTRCDLAARSGGQREHLGHPRLRATPRQRSPRGAPPRIDVDHWFPIMCLLDMLTKRECGDGAFGANGSGIRSIRPASSK